MHSLIELQQISILNMSSTLLSNKPSSQQKLAFTIQSLNQIKQWITLQGKCQLHTDTLLLIIINSSDRRPKFQQMCFKCSKCTKLTKFENVYTFQDITNMINFYIQYRSQSSFEQQINLIQSLKQQICEYLKAKRTRKIQWISYFQCLSLPIKNFLLKTDLVQELQVESKQQQAEILQRDYLEELKHWMKNPELFLQSFCLASSKKIIENILWIKNNINLFTKKILNVFIKFRICTEDFSQQQIIRLFTNIENSQKQTILKRIKTVVNKQNCKKVDQKVSILKKMKCCIKQQSNLQVITQDLKKFIKLYENTFSKTKYLKFNILQNVSYLTSNIVQTIVSLRQAHITKSLNIPYKPMDYQSEFQNLDNGLFVFHNQFRSDTFYDRQIELNRSIQTVVGQQYLHKKDNRLVRSSSFNLMDGQAKYSNRIIELNQPISYQQKTFFKLRLNFQLDGFFNIGVRWSSSFQNFVQDIRDESCFIKIKITPDFGNEKPQHIQLLQVFEKEDNFQQNQTNIKQFQGQNSFQISQNYLKYEFEHKNNEEGQLLQSQIIFEVTQDDEISVFFNEKKMQLVYFNQSQHKYICFKNFYVQNWFNFQFLTNKKSQSQSTKTLFPIYLSIILNSSIPEIQILEK